jgi:hypothetical protein
MGKDSLLSSAGMLLGFRLDSRAVIAKAAAGLPLCKGVKKPPRSSEVAWEMVY